VALFILEPFSFISRIIVSLFWSDTINYFYLQIE